MILATSRIRAILFDLDGTLADTDDAYIQKVARLVQPVRFVFPQRDPTRFLRWGLMQAETPLNWLMTVPDQLGLDHRLAAVMDSVQRMRGQGSPANFLLVAQWE